MARPSSLPFRLAITSFAAVIVAFFGLLIGNVAYHAFHHSSKTPTTVEVLALKVLAPSTLQIRGSITNLSDHSATITCLIGVLKPADPLAYPRRITVTLSAGNSRVVTVTRTLLKPQASTVTKANIPFTCT